MKTLFMAVALGAGLLLQNGSAATLTPPAGTFESAGTLRDSTVNAPIPGYDPARDLRSPAPLATVVLNATPGSLLGTGLTADIVDGAVPEPGAWSLAVLGFGLISVSRIARLRAFRK